MSNTLKPMEVTTSKIATYAVTESKLAKDSVTNEKIKDAAVTTSKVGRNAVTSEKIASNAVTNQKIADEAVTTAKIADGAVTADKISDGVINRPFAPPLVSAEIGDNQIIESKLANNAVTEDKVKNGAITGAKIEANTITQDKLAANSVGTLEVKDAAVTNPKIVDGAVKPSKVDAVNSPTDGQALTYETASGRFKYATPSAVITRPIVPPIATAEIAGGAVTPDKLSFTPITRPLTPPLTPAEMEDRFSIAQNLLLFSNLSNASVPNTEIDLSPYVPVGTKYAIVVMTHAGANTILYGYKAQFYTKPTVDPAPLYRLDTAQKDFTNYLTVLIPLDSNRKFVTSVYRDGVTTAAELYLMGYIR